MADTDRQSQFLRRALVKKILRRTVAFITIVVLVYSLVALVYATKTIYKVKMNYAVVLERFGGVRQAITDVGWHIRLPFFTRIEQEVPLMNQRLFLGGQLEPMRMISKGNVALWTSGVLTYRIRDLRTWAIENLQPMDLLQGDYDGIVKDLLQSQPVNDLISDREKIKELIFTALKSRPINVGGPTLEQKYGIEVVSFVLKETRFGDKLVEATAARYAQSLLDQFQAHFFDLSSSIEQISSSQQDKEKVAKIFNEMDRASRELNNKIHQIRNSVVQD